MKHEIELIFGGIYGLNKYCVAWFAIRLNAIGRKHAKFVHTLWQYIASRNIIMFVGNSNEKFLVKFDFRKYGFNGINGKGNIEVFSLTQNSK